MEMVGHLRIHSFASRRIGDLWSDFLCCKRTDARNRDPARSGRAKGGRFSIVLGQGLGLAIIGAAVGLICALIVSHLMASLLYGVRPTDPLTFAGVALLSSAWL